MGEIKKKNQKEKKNENKKKKQNKRTEEFNKCISAILNRIIISMFLLLPLHFNSYFLFTSLKYVICILRHILKWKVLLMLNANVNDTIVMGKIQCVLTITWTLEHIHYMLLRNLRKWIDLFSFIRNVNSFLFIFCWTERNLQHWLITSVKRSSNDGKKRKYLCMCYDLIFMPDDYDQVEPQKSYDFPVLLHMPSFAPFYIKLNLNLLEKKCNSFCFPH